jgi:Sensors of blue-light using FAD
MSRAGASVNSLYCVLYRSAAQAAFNAARDLPRLTESAQIFNSRHGITGMLLFNSGFFVQYLEGAERDVLMLMNNISVDPRHSQITVLAKHSITKRHYGSWSMESFELRELENVAKARIDNLMRAHSELTASEAELATDGAQSTSEIALQLLARYMTPPGFQ